MFDITDWQIFYYFLGLKDGNISKFCKRPSFVHCSSTATAIVVNLWSVNGDQTAWCWFNHSKKAQKHWLSIGEIVLKNEVSVKYIGWICYEPSTTQAAGDVHVI